MKLHYLFSIGQLHTSLSKSIHRQKSKFDRYSKWNWNEYHSTIIHHTVECWVFCLALCALWTSKYIAICYHFKHTKKCLEGLFYKLDTIHSFISGAEIDWESAHLFQQYGTWATKFFTKQISSLPGSKLWTVPNCK